MKCPNCGAEIKGTSKICEFCDSSLPAQMIKDQEQLNKVGCPKCGSTNVSFSREKQGEIRGKSGTSIVRSTIGVCKDCGYTWQTNSGTNTTKKKRTWLWVLGWICIFPIPLTILLLRKKEMKPALKYGIIAAAWILYLIIGLCGNANTNNTDIADDNNASSQTEVTEQNTDSSKQDTAIDTNVALEDTILSFIEEFNSKSEEALVFVENFTLSDKNSSHYRTEFRLSAYAEAIGKSYSYNGAIVDLVVRKDIIDEITYRVYMKNATTEQCLKMIELASPIMDTSLTAKDLQEALNYISENKSANGYYYGELGMVLVGDDLMLKMKND